MLEWFWKFFDQASTRTSKVKEKLDSQKLCNKIVNSELNNDIHKLFQQFDDKTHYQANDYNLELLVTGFLRNLIQFVKVLLSDFQDPHALSNMNNQKRRALSKKRSIFEIIDEFCKHFRAVVLFTISLLNLLASVPKLTKDFLENSIVTWNRHINIVNTKLQAGLTSLKNANTKVGAQNDLLNYIQKLYEHTRNILKNLQDDLLEKNIFVYKGKEKLIFQNYNFNN